MSHNLCAAVVSIAILCAICFFQGPGSEEAKAAASTTSTEAGGSVVIVYAASDLMSEGSNLSGVIAEIVANVAPTSWEEAGGQGTIAGFSANNSIVVRQSREVHDELVEYLAKKR